MKTSDFTTSILVDKAPKEVFKAINNVRGWWSENIAGDTDKVDHEFKYHYQDVHRCTIKVTELVPNEKVEWHVVDNYFKFTKDEKEWKDTQVIFEIFEKQGKTLVNFTHQGLVPAYECFDICRDAWTHYIQESLKELIEKQKGSPTPKEEEQNGSEIAPSGSQDFATDNSTKRIYHRLLIEAPVEKVYGALTTQEGLASWWTPETIAKPEEGSISRFAFGEEYFKEIKVEKLIPYSKVQWVCRKAVEEWIGTTITFELEPHQKGAVLYFHHDNWKAYTAGFATCSFDWALFLRSLKLLCETGKGRPFPDFH